ncbi:MAG: hypothetical protein U9N81_14460 [Bacillota bacterium]|nr:hypothetical protein [Bacillota bacterium]
MNYPGLDIVLAFLYLIIIWNEGKNNGIDKNSQINDFFVTLIWQLPGLLLIAFLISNTFFYAIFVLELWITPVLPFISLFPVGMQRGDIFYTWTFILAVLWLAGVYLLPALLSIRKIDPLDHMRH